MGRGGGVYKTHCILDFNVNWEGEGEGRGGGGGGRGGGGINTGLIVYWTSNIIGRGEERERGWCAAEQKSRVVTYAYQSMV